MKKEYKNFIIVVSFVLLFVAFFYVQNSITGNFLLEKYSDTEYAPPYDVFNNNATIFSVTPEYLDAAEDGEIVNLNVDVSIDGGYVFQKGYVYNFNTSSWEVFNFDQETVRNSYWIEDHASKDLIINSSQMLRNGENYVVAYTCKKYGTVWNCGCNNVSESACKRWMLQLVNVSNIALPIDTTCITNADCNVGNCTGGVCIIGNVIPPMQDGTLAHPYLISDWYGLNNMRNNLTASYKLISSLSSSSPGYVGIGDNWQRVGDCFYCDGRSEGKFIGNFDGNGKTISDLIANNFSITGTLIGNGHIGLFGATSGNIYNLGLVNADVGGYGVVGALVGTQIGGVISNCYSTGTVRQESGGEDPIAGGLVGILLEGEIFNSYSKANVYSEYHSGGLVGWSSGGIIYNSYATGNVTARYVAGGLTAGIGAFNRPGKVWNSYSSGNVNVDSFGPVGNSYAGGLVGRGMDHAEIIGSFSTGNVTGFANFAGGFIGGLESAEISNSYWYDSGQGLKCFDNSWVSNPESVECFGVPDLSYFYNYDNNPMVLSSGREWDFGGAWSPRNQGVGLPVLRNTIPLSSSFCTDSDGGSNYIVSGSTMSSSGINIDSCINSTHLNETVCSGVNPSFNIAYCNSGCNVGRCYTAFNEIVSGCKYIANPGIYTLSSNIYGYSDGGSYCIFINSNNVILDGNGYSIIGDGGVSPSPAIITQGNNITIRDLNIEQVYNVNIRIGAPTNLNLINLSFNRAYSPGASSFIKIYGFPLESSNFEDLSFNSESFAFLFDSDNALVNNNLFKNIYYNGAKVSSVYNLGRFSTLTPEQWYSRGNTLS